MNIRLAGGVVASDLCAWMPGASGPNRLPDEGEPERSLEGAAVALGPYGATDEQVRDAVAELDRLVEAGGVVAAGAGVDLGSGFRSARLAGAPGDQRDAVLAALRVLGVADAGRLGERAGFLVALFGPAVTKRVGAAAARAIEEGRWPALCLASAASDVLGPEQLEKILALRAPEGADIVPGRPSSLAEYLRQILESVSRPHRDGLLLDLWERVLEHHAGLARRERRMATQSRKSRVADLTKRRERYDDDLIVTMVAANLNTREPTLADAARWEPPTHYWHDLFDRLLNDALAATALLRTAVAVADHGMEEGLARSEAVIRAAEAQLSDQAANQAARSVPGLTGLPPRPGVYVRDIRRVLSGERRGDSARQASYVRPRLAGARDYALTIIASADELFFQWLHLRREVLRDWASPDLRSWRDGAGYSPVRPPAEWSGIPPWTGPLLGDTAPLSERLATAPDSEVGAVERVGDLLWYAELLDALAQVFGHEAARPTPGTGAPWFWHDPPPEEREPLSPSVESVTLAVSVAAQVRALGGTPPRNARTWAGLIAGLMEATTIAESLTGEFAVPAPLAAVDGRIVTGTGLRLKVARSARVLAEWSNYMGNCIAGPHYLEAARSGGCGLVGLYDRQGILRANAELRLRRPAARGWEISEIAARFNDSPEQSLVDRFREWVDAIPGTTADEPEPAPPDEEAPGRPVRRRPRPRLVEDAGPPLRELARRAWEEQGGDEALATFAVLARTPADAALTRLRRLGPASFTDACRRALETGAVDLDRLWAVGGVRPLSGAVEALDPALRNRFERLSLLLGEPPLPGALRRLARLPGIAEAYALDLVGRRTRRAIGRLACEDDPLIARAMTGRPVEAVLCALTIAITCRDSDIDLTPVAPPRTVAVPGYPATDLSDAGGPWQHAFISAHELGADRVAFWAQIAEHGLRVPTSWLGAGGWVALWSRAHSRRQP